MSVDIAAIRKRAAPVVKRFELELAELRDRARSLRPSSFTTSMSQVASGAHAGDAAYVRWLELLDERNTYHRKSWEWCYIMEALDRHHVLRPGQTGARVRRRSRADRAGAGGARRHRRGH